MAAAGSTRPSKNPQASKGMCTARFNVLQSVVMYCTVLYLPGCCRRQSGPAAAVMICRRPSGVFTSTSVSQMEV